ncbi:hypothetical protein MRB53_016704 [Persea americana]|uniref:Uncharacterized protein n=1 Tax=Persea americana TaxID=3435 RepID=A0ACC2M307_PERAE|nr:hypothetical protein MRB53_016704 [Persea americana]|eukprot:TRINITY_DN7821_c4_g1_i1.p1 TRINITY_DN7821_c4_g1~~TRINITY_DN7821_c4_g1_i1.p1  ORF type:complete len:207 (+),score=46.93 TRINITY_DN7821_c4_g1_i1:3-623(+)
MNADSDFLLRQLSNGKDLCNSSNRWCKKVPERSLHQMEGLNLSSDNGLSLKKRVMVVVDHSTRAKHAMMWALTHVANKGDLLTLLHIIPPHKGQSKHFSASSSHLAHSLGSLCTACKPEVEVEALVIQGQRLPTVLSQVKKLEASVLVLGQKTPTVNCLFWSSCEDFVEQCINNAECLTLAVRKQSSGVGGYLISTRWRKNFWLLA